MQLEQAIRTAIEYERRVRGVYADALAQAGSAVAKRVFRLLAAEESAHVALLTRTLADWVERRELRAADLATAVPSSDAIAAAIESVARSAEARADAGEIAVLERALEVEKETSAFYEGLVRDLPAEGRLFFERFVEVELGHLALVQAEIDALRGIGFWFDMPEFDLERG